MRHGGVTFSLFTGSPPLFCAGKLNLMHFDHARNNGSLHPRPSRPGPSHGGEDYSRREKPKLTSDHKGDKNVAVAECGGFYRRSGASNWAAFSEFNIRYQDKCPPAERVDSDWISTKQMKNNIESGLIPLGRVSKQRSNKAC